MERLKIYVVGDATYYADWIKDSELTEDLESANIVLFTGGEDIDPSLYNARKHPTTHSNLERDLYEKEIFEKIKPNQLALGICRGSQFLCVANGGILVQDCDGHALISTHSITDGDIQVSITSTHHQMQYPFNLDKSQYDILFWSTIPYSYIYEGDLINPYGIDKEPEIVCYHKDNMPKCLAIQGHPEIMRKESPIIDVLNNLVKKCLEKD